MEWRTTFVVSMQKSTYKFEEMLLLSAQICYYQYYIIKAHL